MKLDLEEITEVVNALASAFTYAKQARRVAMKVYGDPEEVSLDLKYAYLDLQRARAIMEGRDK